MTAKRIWLHIGMLKTGTSAMQQWFTAHETELRQKRLLYLRGRKNFPASGELAHALARRTPEAGKLVDRVLQQIFEAGDEIDDVLLSSEDFSAFGPRSLSPLVRALEGQRLFILIWLRRQDRFAEALYKQSVKWNGRFGDIQSFLQPQLLKQLDYDAMLREWQEAFPGAALMPQIYEESNAGKKPDSIASMLTAIGRPDLIPPDSRDWRRNQSPKAALIAHYRQIPRETAPALRKANRKLMKEFGDGAAGRGDVMPPELARGLLERFEESNRQLQMHRFPERPMLFDHEFEGGHLADEAGTALIERFDQYYSNINSGDRS